ncbi:SRPBCC family protein [Jeotgalibacillus proteolyticus]|uniref:Activator of Hsp90 ATPase homologue 1/2-like C-terminal domain-containing protein n=1 Tax=Jeotgalibacillus proteolyticus TaxID=2082395 RepID=A0A2S5G943_9BACL|nr:SRPBCC family protein [Jeotgalibacillus proteolyticus]PPA69520.1 hypothetical protein C4B60_13290 [Jeotgalibacillus proteolyticus]
MNNYGTLQESNNRYALRFERLFTKSAKEVYSALTNPKVFSEWYPFATGEMDLRIGGRISFDDGEGTTYSGTITDLKEPYVFGFKEMEDQIYITLEEGKEGCRMIFTHTFEDGAWAINTAAGWHRCLDVLAQIINNEPITWQDNADELREFYGEAFNSNR